jgi:hypothetical protein
VLINQLRGDKSRKQSAHEELWKAQGSTLFCTTGKLGLHNNTLRNAVYSALLRAERLTRERGKFSPSLISFDFNMDGVGEWLFLDTRISCYVQSTGGGICELDYLPKVWNYLDSCQGRTAFSDRLLPPETQAENLDTGDVHTARMCCKEHYDLGEMDKVRRALSLVLAPNQQENIPFGCIEIVKSFYIKKDTVIVAYSLINRGEESTALCFAPEVDLALPGEACTRFFAWQQGNQDASLPALNELLLNAVDGIKIHDLENEVHISLAANRPFDGRIVPVYFPNVDSSPGLYQAFCLMPLFRVSLNAGESWDVEFNLKFSN